MKLPLTRDAWYTLRDGTFAQVTLLRDASLTARLLPPGGDERTEQFARDDFARQVVGRPTRAEKRAWKLRYMQTAIIGQLVAEVKS